jgi:AAT family amino acid transporter
LIFLINVWSVRSFGEVEFFMSFVKVGIVGIFILVGILVVLGVFGEPEYLNNWTYKEAPFVGGFKGLLNVFLVT